MNTGMRVGHALKCASLLGIAATLAACVAGGPAPVSDRTTPGSAPRPPIAKPDPVPAPTPAPAPAPTATPQPTQAESAVVAKPLAEAGVPVHIVKPGDTLSSIARANAVLVRDLVAWNNIEDPGNISVGQSIRLAPPGGVAAVPIKPPGAAGQPAAADSGPKTQPLAQRVPFSEQAYAKMAKAPTPAEPVAPPAAKPDAKPDVAPKPEVAAKPDAAPAAKPDAATANAEWIWPVEGKVIANFNGSSNKGITIAGKRGQPVVASAAGRVIFSGIGLRGLGRFVVIRHNNAYLSVYAHNDKLLVKEGQTVTKGQRIAEMGSSDTDQVKLHFEIRRQGKPVDPVKLLPGT